MMSYEQLVRKTGIQYKHQMLSQFIFPHFIRASVGLLIKIRAGFLREPYAAFNIGGVILHRRPTLVRDALTLQYKIIMDL